MFTQTWETAYKDHKIKVVNRWIGPSELFIDGVIKDSTSGLFSGKLFGKITEGEKERDVKVFLGSRAMSVRCDILIDDKVIYTSSK